MFAEFEELKMEENRRKPVLTHQMSVINHPPQFRTLNREKPRLDDSDDDDKGGGGGEGQEAREEDFPPSSGTTDSAATVSRTLFDIIQDEESTAAFAYRSLISGANNHHGGSGHKINWKGFKERLRIRRTGNGWGSPGRSGTVACSGNCPAPGSPRPHGRTKVLTRNKSRAGMRVLETGGPAAEEVVVATSMLGDFAGDKEEFGCGATEGEERERGEEEEEEEEEGEEEERGRGGDEEVECGVCMARRRGEVFEPCMHTFCKLCSRQLWVGSWNCPLCNGYVSEIIHLF